MARSAILFAAALSALAAGPALAQVGAPLQTPMPGAGTITAPDEIRYCLCAHQSVDILGARVAAETARHQEVQDRLAALDKQMADSKANVDVNQPDQVEAYRRLVEAREKTMAEFYYELTPRLQQLVARYNASTAAYNASCTTRSLDALMLENVKATLSCPVEP
ncbi:MAG TPA: hypothetical protein VGV37_22050 [Aliidongia sp.]|uniref:hypothetical protein n=1 Tax=Aliidongia sp. TaxID=1914230 RepID=UPI002DDCD073|nr:hypothetical protein [Aliidongia sp.]HEV2677226.1 hypothetical protein [Aliidongia sp.]